MIKNCHRNSQGWKIILFMCIITPLFSAIGLCFEFDNTKEYDSKDRSITVSNSFLQLIDLDAIAKITPTTPHVNPVIRGEDRLVAEFTIESYLTYKEKVWDNMKFYNVRSGKEISRNFKIRYKDVESYDYPNYVESCKDTGKINKTDGKSIWDCTYTYAPITKLRPVWRDLDINADLPKGFIEIGVFADVKAGDNVEFIPTWFGVSMPEYAVWTDSYNNGLVAYFDGNITANMITSYPQVNLSFSEGSPSSGIEESCLIGKCLNSTPSNDWKIAANEITNFSKDYTWNFWVKGVNTGGGYPFFMCYDIGSGNTNIGWNSPTDVYVGDSIVGTGSSSIGTPSIGDWFMITIKRNDTDGNVTVYYDGQPKLEGTTGVLQDYQSNLILGDHCNGIFDWEGYFDELGYWNRTLNDFEINDLYNSGAGLTYDSGAASSNLTVTLISPSYGAYLTENTSYFNSSATIANGNLTNATLHIWNATAGVEFTNYTAISGMPLETAINLSYTLPDGFWKWNVEYCGQDDLDLAVCNYASINSTFEIDATPPNFTSWNDTFSEGLVAYFDGNTTVNMVTINPQVNLSALEGSPLNGSTETCLIGRCLNVTEGSSWKIVNNSLTNYTGNYTFNFWVRGVSSGESLNPYFLGGNENGDHQMGWNDASLTNIYVSDKFTGSPISSLAGYGVGYKKWFMITVTGDGENSNVSVYFNGTIKSSGDLGTPKQHDIYLGNLFSEALDWQGQFDEIAWWNRTLSLSEVRDLYNFGVGLSYSQTFPSLITVQLGYPPNSISNLSSHYFNSSATIANGNLTNATLHLWKTGTELTNFTEILGLPNATSINQSLTLTDGSWEWNVEYCGVNETNTICGYDTANNTLLIDTITPIVNITYPMNTNYDYLVDSLNFTLNETNPGTCRFDNMTLNQTTSCSLNVTGNNSHEGNNKWIMWVNDTVGNTNSSSIEFIVDSIFPLINFTAPTPINGFNITNPNFTIAVNVTDENLDNVTYYLYNSTHNLINETFLLTNPSFYGFETNTLEGWQSQDSAPAKAIALPCVSGTRCFPTQESYGVNLSIHNSGITKTFSRLQDIYFDVRTRDSSGQSNISLRVNGVIYNNTLPDVNGSVSYTFEPPIDNAVVVIYSRPCVSLCAYDDMFTIDNITVNKRTLSYYNLSTGIYYYNVTATDIANHKNSTETRSLNIDTELPAVFVYEPKGMGLVYANQNVSINFSATDSVGNIEGCWFNYNGTNFTIPCATNNTMLLNKPNFLTFFANHTAGGYNSTTHYWNYAAFISNYSFVGLTYAGFSSPFSINFSLNSSAFSGINMKLSYNGTNYTMTSTDAGDDKKYTYTLSVPTTTTEINRTFFYIFELTNDSGVTVLETKQFNQTIKSFLIDNCSTNINPILNMRMLDEETLLAINGTIEVNVHLYSQSTNELVNSYNDTFNYDNNFSAWSTICTSNFTGAFKMAYTIRHYGNQSIYFKKFRVAQNQTISNQTMPVNITLYNLLLASGYSFVIKAREASQTTNLLIEAYKQYVGLDNYSLVESQLTDVDGNAILHLTPSSVNYRFIVSYEGQVISIQDSQQMICNNLATLDCQATLNLGQAATGIPNYNQLGSIAGSYNYNSTSKLLTFTFISTDGNPHVVNSHVLLNDVYGNTTICNGTYTGTAGIITCPIPEVYMNTTAYANLLVDGNQTATTFFSTMPENNMYGADIVLELMMFSSLVLLLVAHPILIVIGALLGVFFSITLIFITSGSWTSIIASLVFYIVAGGIIIWQIGRRL